MTTIKRTDFVAQHAGRSLDINKVEEDAAAKAELAQAGVSIQDLRRADKNADGVVSVTEAFAVADRFDRDGNAGTLVARRADGTATQAGNATTALGLMLGRHNLQPSSGTPAQPATPASNDDILMVGMNNATEYSAGSAHEHKELVKAGAKVTYIKDSSAGQDRIKVAGKTYDLTTDTGRSGFTATLGLPADQQKKIADAIAGTDEGGKDEMAQIATVWARAERGESMPSRLLLSGHHVGSGVYGDHNGKLNWEAMQALAKAMPAAAGRVEDLHISACYSGGEAKHQMYRELFPNVKTIWAYSGSAPGAGSGATVHQAHWERTTRGAGTDVEGTMQRLRDRGVRKADVIDAVSTPAASVGDTAALDRLRQGIRDGESTFARHFTGEDVQANPQQGPLRSYYNQLQGALQNPAVTGQERTELEARRDQTIRTLFYSAAIAPRFAATHGEAVRQGYGSLGLPVPDFSKLSRAEAQQAITTFRARLEHTHPQPSAAQNLLPLLNGLWNLDSRTIPETWI